MYERIFALPCSERIQNLRTEVVDHPVSKAVNTYSEPYWPLHYSGDRWLSPLFLEGWVKFKNQPTTILRRARAEAYQLENARPIIGENELIVGLLDFRELPEDDYEKFIQAANAFKEMSPNLRIGRTDHICLDYPKLLRVGVNGLIREIEEKQAALDLNHPDTIAENTEKTEFYTGALIELKALLELARRYSETALEMAKTATPRRAAELAEIAEIMKYVPASPARTFREAVQSVHFYTFNLFGLYPGGRPDRYLRPFYEADLEAGRLTLEQAQDIVDNYCLFFSTYVFMRAACGVMLAGSDAQGNPVGNAVTAHFLHSIPHVRRPDPNYSYAVSPDPDPELFGYATKLIAAGESHPSFYNDRAIIASLTRQGVQPEDAPEFINTTCAEITICGRSSQWTTMPYINCFEVFNAALHSGKEFTSVNDLLNEFEHTLNARLDEQQALYNLHYLERRRNGAEPLRVSCLIDDCLATGRSIWNNGARYNAQLPSFTGTSNITEAVSTINELVFRSREYTLRGLTEIVDSDYRGHEDLRLRIINTLPHYGNGNPEVDSFMVRIMDIVRKACADRYNYRGSKWLPGAFPYMTHVSAGYLPGADGRKAGTPLASCPGPLNGFDRHGPTTSLLSSSTWDQSDFLGGITMNLRFTQSQMSAAGPETIGALIRTFFSRNGMQLQINTVDAATLEDAMKHPENYADLLVRIGGYSDLFVNQTEKLQREIITRTAFEV